MSVFFQNILQPQLVLSRYDTYTRLPLTLCSLRVTLNKGTRAEGEEDRCVCWIKITKNKKKSVSVILFNSSDTLDSTNITSLTWPVKLCLTHTHSEKAAMCQKHYLQYFSICCLPDSAHRTTQSRCRSASDMEQIRPLLCGAGPPTEQTAAYRKHTDEHIWDSFAWSAQEEKTKKLSLRWRPELPRASLLLLFISKH